MSNIIGIDLGASKIAAGLIVGSKIVKQLKVKTPKIDIKRQLIKTLLETIAELKDKERIEGIGIGVAGRVEHLNGFIYNAPNFPQKLKNFPLAKKLSQVIKKPVKVDNDVHCFTLAEHRFGQARGFRHVVGLTLGTGIGGGIIIDNQLYRGKDNTSGEFGHTIIADQFPKDFTSFENLASGTAVQRFYQVFTGKCLDARAIEERALAGEIKAADSYHLLAHYLAVGLINIIHSLNPEIIVIGGGIARAKTRLWLQLAIREVRKKALTPRAAQTKIVTSKLSDQANILGASLLLY